MEIKLFGKSLFQFNKGGLILESSYNQLKESKYLPDFYTNFNNNNSVFTEYIIAENPSTPGGMVAIPKGKKVEKKPGQNIDIKITPKGIHELKFLNDDTFSLNTDAIYVDGQIEDFKDKLNLLKREEYDMRNGVSEVSSILIRMQNRKKYPEVREFFEEYPYTTTAKINELVKVHDHLKMGQIAQFVADLPKEAVTVMKEYNKYTEKVCAKQAVFYIIADKKDFQKSDKRRDPILLAQSPFTHNWQILGAWDEEMLLLEEL